MQESKQGPQARDDARGEVLDAIQALVGIAARSLAGIAEDVSLPQFRVLVLLHRCDSLTMSALAESLAVNPSTATRLCDRLQDKRLLRRRSDEKDRRAIRVQLTAGGRRLVEQVIRRRNSHVEQILDRLPRQAQDRLATALREFADAAGEVSGEAWMLGWTAPHDDSA